MFAKIGKQLTDVVLERRTRRASSIDFPRDARLGLVDWTTDAKSHNAWWGYSRMTLLIICDKI